MANMTLAINDSIHEELKHFSEIRWSEVARRAIIEKLETLKLAEKIAHKSKLTQKDIDDFSTLIKKNANKNFI